MEITDFGGGTNHHELCLVMFFLASIFVAYVEPKLFFCFRTGKFSSAAPTGARLYSRNLYISSTELICFLV